jgi:hypothetical protein
MNPPSPKIKINHASFTFQDIKSKGNSHDLKKKNATVNNLLSRVLLHVGFSL